MREKKEMQEEKKKESKNNKRQGFMKRKGFEMEGNPSSEGERERLDSAKMKREKFLDRKKTLSLPFSLSIGCCVREELA